MKEYILDVRRLLCPMPVIRLGEKIITVAVGDSIKMLATDRGVLHDIPAWCSIHKHKITKIIDTNNEIVIYIKKNKVE